MPPPKKKSEVDMYGTFETQHWKDMFVFHQKETPFLMRPCGVCYRLRGSIMRKGPYEPRDLE